jgi:hypothetical protein
LSLGKRLRDYLNSKESEGALALRTRSHLTDFLRILALLNRLYEGITGVSVLDD